MGFNQLMRLLSSSSSDTTNATTNGSHGGSHLNASLANATDAHAASGHHLFPLTHHPALLLMMFCGVVVRSLMRMLPKKSFHPPFTVACCLLGVLMAAIADLCDKDASLGCSSELGSSILEWERSTHPDIILFLLVRHIQETRDQSMRLTMTIGYKTRWWLHILTYYNLCGLLSPFSSSFSFLISL